METAEAKTVHEIIFIVQSYHYSKSCNKGTIYSDKEKWEISSDVDGIKNKIKNEMFLFPAVWAAWVNNCFWLEASQRHWAQGLSRILMFGCHGGEAVGLGYHYIDNLLTGHFLIRSLLDADTLCTQRQYLKGVCACAWKYINVCLCICITIYGGVCLCMWVCVFRCVVWASLRLLYKQ